MMFAAFLCCLYKIGVFIEADAVAVVLKLFYRYEPRQSEGRTREQCEDDGVEPYEFVAEF